MPFDKANPPANNLYGVGYVVEKTPITVAGWADADPAKNRVFKMWVSSYEIARLLALTILCDQHQPEQAQPDFRSTDILQTSAYAISDDACAPRFHRLSGTSLGTSY